MVGGNHNHQHFETWIQNDTKSKSKNCASVPLFLFLTEHTYITKLDNFEWV